MPDIKEAILKACVVFLVDWNRSGDDLYLRWTRDAYGARGSRDLWVLVSTGFFCV